MKGLITRRNSINTSCKIKCSCIAPHSPIEEVQRKCQLYKTFTLSYCKIQPVYISDRLSWHDSWVIKLWQSACSGQVRECRLYTLLQCLLYCQDSRWAQISVSNWRACVHIDAKQPATRWLLPVYSQLQSRLIRGAQSVHTELLSHKTVNLHWWETSRRQMTNRQWQILYLNWS